MRALVFLLLFASCVFSSPPINEMMAENSIAAIALSDYYNESIANNATLVIDFGIASKEIAVSASVDIAGFNLIVDKRTSAYPGLSLITAQGYMQGHLGAKPSEGYSDFICDRDWYYGGMGYAWRCDFDLDTCAEYENSTSVEYDGIANFTFRNLTVSVPFSSNVISVPDGMLEAMKDSSGAENITISLDGDVNFTYEIDNRGLSGPDCVSFYQNHSILVPFSANASFPVAGMNKLFYLRSPVLKEQWFRSNHFDSIVLSQAPLFYAEIFMDGNQSRNITLREFYNETGAYNLTVIYSNKTEEDGWSESENLTSPWPLETGNHSYAFIYEFNHSYLGIGEHNLSLFIEDSFLGYGSYNASLLSRMLTYNNAYTEEGKPINDSYAMPSVQIEKQEISSVEIALGFVAMILFLAFLNFWLPE